MRPYGTDSPYEMFRQAARYRLSEEEIGRIRCPVLVLDPEGEQFWPGQSRQLYDGLGGPREIVTIADADGGRFHCEPTNFGTRDAIVFDWLDRTLGLT